MSNCQRGYNNVNRPVLRQAAYGYMEQPVSAKPAVCRPTPPPVKPMPKHQLMNYINEVSFAVNDMLLYLDTHPHDLEAQAYCKKHMEMRVNALKDYAKHYGPLTLDTADKSCSESWDWVTQPWPWEGGAC